MRNHSISVTKLKQFDREFCFQKSDTPTDRPSPAHSKLWFPTPETSKDFFQIDASGKTIYIQFLKLERLEEMDPDFDNFERKRFLEKFSRHTCVLNGEKSQLEKSRVKKLGYDMIAGHCFDMSYNTELKNKPKD